jgi:ferritin-like metal-binding protein YciE
MKEMGQLKQMMVEEMQDLLNAEMQLTSALPKMAKAAHNPMLKQAFEKHLQQTETHIQRLRIAFEMLGGKAEGKTCRAMKGLIEEGEERIQEGSKAPQLASDLALITAAQKVEHYEISGYGSVRSMARLIGEKDVEHLLTHTLGEEEATDFLLTEIAKPMLQQARSEELGGSKTDVQHGRAKAATAV